MRQAKLFVLIVGLMTTFALVAAACGGDNDDEGAEPASQASDASSQDASSQDSGSQDSGSQDSGSSLSGRVTISGSSTVEPISVRVAELFEDVAPDVQVTVDGPGTGDGFKLFCEGETDISDASRAIKDSEAADCANAMESNGLSCGWPSTAWR